MDFTTNEARELYFYATSDVNSYRAWLLSAYQNLERKWRRGVFERDKALKLLASYTLVSIGKQHRNEFGSMLFPPQVRNEVAGILADYVVAELELGNSWLPERRAK
jgi:hypothetical protein